MTTPRTLINDNEFLQQFELKTLDPTHFDHYGHLRLSWLYLNNHGIDKAITLTCTGIKAYAESLGAKDKFHLTITTALVRIMALRIESMPKQTWPEFLFKNSDLVNNSLGVVLYYYSKKRLFSDEAKTVLLMPDLKQLGMLNLVLTKP